MMVVQVSSSEITGAKTKTKYNAITNSTLDIYEQSRLFNINIFKKLELTKTIVNNYEYKREFTVQSLPIKISTAKVKINEFI